MTQKRVLDLDCNREQVGGESRDAFEAKQLVPGAATHPRK